MQCNWIRCQCYHGRFMISRYDYWGRLWSVNTINEVALWSVNTNSEVASWSAGMIVAVYAPSSWCCSCSDTWGRTCRNWNLWAHSKHTNWTLFICIWPIPGTQAVKHLLCKICRNAIRHIYTIRLHSHSHTKGHLLNGHTIDNITGLSAHPPLHLKVPVQFYPNAMTPVHREQ